MLRRAPLAVEAASGRDVSHSHGILLRCRSPARPLARPGGACRGPGVVLAGRMSASPLHWLLRPRAGCSHKETGKASALEKEPVLLRDGPEGGRPSGRSAPAAKSHRGAPVLSPQRLCRLLLCLVRAESHSHHNEKVLTAIGLCT